LDVINRTKDTNLTAEQFLADCQARSGSEETYQQSYMCNPLGAATASIVEWSAIERCRDDYYIERVHLESDQVLQRFGQVTPYNDEDRQGKISAFIRASFPSLFNGSSHDTRHSSRAFRLGFDVAASGTGDLAVIYIDEVTPPSLTLRALLTCRTEDWHFLSC